MILFDNSAFLNFPRFGIKIPALDSRKTKTLDNLLTNPDFSGRSGEWLIDGFDDVYDPDDLNLAHSPDYVRGFFGSSAAQQLQNAYELVNADGSLNRWEPENAESPLEDMVPLLQKSFAGTYRAGCISLDRGFCHFLGGGAHHGHADFGHGFCPLNDTALAIRKLMDERRISKAWVIDVDAHKGDGTAAIFSSDDRVRTLSVHMAKGWPLDGSLPPTHPSYTPSDIDVPIESGEEDTYLDRLTTALFELKQNFPTDLAVVLAGADPWEGDALPSTCLLELSSDQMLERDIVIYEFLERAGIPSAWLTAGGYGEGSWQIHTNFLSWVLNKRLGP